MLLSTALKLFSTSLFTTVNASEQCDTALAAAYKELSTGSEKVLPVPDQCKDYTGPSNPIDTTPLVTYKTNLKSYCAFVFNSYNIIMTSYSYDDSIASYGDITLGLGDISGIFENPSTSNGCGSGLAFMGNTTTNQGWDLFVESYDSTSDSCEVPDNDTLFETLFLSLEGWTDVQKKTSFCVMYQPIGSTWRGVVRGLYTNETLFTSPANIPCVLEFENFDEHVCPFDNL